MQATSSVFSNLLTSSGLFAQFRPTRARMLLYESDIAAFDTIFSNILSCPNTSTLSYVVAKGILAG